MGESPPEDRAVYRPPADEGAPRPRRGLRAIELARRARLRSRRWILVTTACVLALTALFVWYGGRWPSGLNRPAPPPSRELDAAAYTAPLITVQPERVLVDGTVVAQVDPQRVQRIDGLDHALRQRREQFRQQYPSTPFPGEAILDIDPAVPAAVVKSVVHTASYAGYPTVQYRLPEGGRW